MKLLFVSFLFTAFALLFSPQAGAQTPEKEAEWKREISAGYNLNQGNTENDQLSGTFHLNRKTERNEFTLKSDLYRSTSADRTDAERYGGFLRYAFSFGEELAWYQFNRLEARRDQFANIDWRLTPSGGFGYWFSDEPDWKMMVEFGAGWERTEFRDTTPNRSEVIVAPRAFFEKGIGPSKLSQDLIVWPRADDFGEYRLRSETVFTNPINGGFSLRVSLIDRFESDPAAQAKKNDLQLISSLVYSF